MVLIFSLISMLSPVFSASFERNHTSIAQKLSIPLSHFLCLGNILSLISERTNGTKVISLYLKIAIATQISAIIPLGIRAISHPVFGASV